MCVLDRDQECVVGDLREDVCVCVFDLWSSAPQVQDVVPITSCDTAGSFLLHGWNNGSIYYIGTHTQTHTHTVTEVCDRPSSLCVCVCVRHAEISSEDEG